MSAVAGIILIIISHVQIRSQQFRRRQGIVNHLESHLRLPVARVGGDAVPGRCKSGNRDRAAGIEEYRRCIVAAGTVAGVADLSACRLRNPAFFQHAVQ